MTNPSQDVLLLSGATGGIGREIAKLFIKVGFCVSLAARNTEDLVEIFGPENDSRHYVQYNVLSCDGIDYEAPKEWVRQAVRKFGRITCLINNAGSSSRVSAMGDDEKGFERDFFVNALGPLLLMRECMPYLEEAAKEKGGATPCILNIGSLSGGVRIRSSVSGSYSGSKACLNSYSSLMAAYCGEQSNGVRVTHVALGDVNTAMSQRSKMDPKDKIQPESVAKHLFYIFSLPKEIHEHDSRLDLWHRLLRCVLDMKRLGWDSG